MVTSGSERRLQIFENCAAVVFHRAGLSMHEITGPDYIPSEGCAQSLMAKAHTQNRKAAAELAKQLDADARILRRAWAGRNEDTFRTQSLHFFHRDLIIAAHDNFRAQLTQILHQVVGERIVVVQNKNHCYQITSAAGLSVSEALSCPKAWIRRVS